jgi:hypothetical protein
MIERGCVNTKGKKKILEVKNIPYSMIRNLFQSSNNSFHVITVPMLVNHLEEKNNEILSNLIFMSQIAIQMNN